MTSVDYKTKVYDIYMIKEDLGFTAEEKPKADCSGISVFSLGIAITTAASSKNVSVCKYAWFLQDSLFNSFILPGSTLNSGHKFTLATTCFPPEVLQILLILYTGIFDYIEDTNSDRLRVSAWVSQILLPLNI